MVNSFYPNSSNKSPNDDLDTIVSFGNVVINAVQTCGSTTTTTPTEVGIQGKKGLILSPAIYEVSTPIKITQQHFVILGLGFPTLVSMETCQLAKKHHGNKRSGRVGKQTMCQMPISFKGKLCWMPVEIGCLFYFSFCKCVLKFLSHTLLLETLFRSSGHVACNPLGGRWCPHRWGFTGRWFWERSSRQGRSTSTLAPWRQRSYVCSMRFAGLGTCENGTRHEIQIAKPLELLELLDVYECWTYPNVRANLKTNIKCENGP